MGQWTYQNGMLQLRGREGKKCFSKLQAVKRELEHDISEYLCLIKLRDIALENTVDALVASLALNETVLKREIDIRGNL